MVFFETQSFKDQVLGAEKPVLVDFFADWCGPCQMLAPVLEKLSQEYEGKVLMGKVDLDKETSLASEYGVMSIPTLILFKDGKEAARQVGVLPEAELRRWLDEALE